MIGQTVGNIFEKSPLLRILEFENCHSLQPVSEEIVKAADRICDHIIEVFELRGIRFGEKIAWCHWLQGKCKYGTNYGRFRAPDACSDIKYVWELNRHQHFTLLAVGYKITGNEKYAKEFFSQIDDWIDENPPAQGVNWISSLELAVRCISWIFALAVFRHSRLFKAGLKAKVLKAIVLHGRYISKNLSFREYPNNHLIGEAVGLFVIGVLFDGTEVGRQFQDTGIRILDEQFESQVHADGIDREQAVDYHRFVLDLVALVYVIADKLKIELSVSFHNTLKLMYKSLRYLVRPDGYAPMLGDDDSGRAYKLGFTSGGYLLPALSTGAALFEQGEMKWMAKAFHPESSLLLGANAKAKFDALEAREPTSQSYGYKDSGYYVMRSGWDSQALYLIFDCGPQGMGQAGHGHADALSIEMYAYGKPLIIDPGTYTYNGPIEWRNFFRGSKSHNTVVVDEFDQAVPLPEDDPFGWQLRVEAKNNLWSTGRFFDYVDGSHSGYHRFEDPVTHRRTIFFVKGEYWIVSDFLSARGKHSYDLYFHLSPGDMTIDAGNQIIRTFYEGSGNILMVPVNDEGLRCRVIEGETNPIQGWVSYSYGSKMPAPVVNYTKAVEGSTRFDTVLFPYQESRSPKLSVETMIVEAPIDSEMENTCARSLVISINEMLDYFLCSPGCSDIKRFGDYESNGEVIYFRITKTGELDKMILINGSYLASKTKFGFSASKKVSVVELLFTSLTLEIVCPDQAIFEFQSDRKIEHITVNGNEATFRKTKTVQISDCYSVDQYSITINL